jgi:alpha-tubulin suppressor-like RCC1 family protein
VESQPVQFLVVWNGPAFIDTLSWTRPHAVMPGATLATDSLRVRVLNVDSLPVGNALVAFSITAGDGSVSPFIDSTDANGVASTQWTLGPGTGLNTVTATVVRADSTPDPLVQDNAATFSITAYNAFSIEAGDAQTGQILADLPTEPAVKLVDSLGAPRAGVAVTFTATKGGRVESATVSTDANGVARPGTWTLGDIPGEQTLEAEVSDAAIELTATATGTPIHYTPAFVVAGGFSTCARESDGTVKCWGDGPQTGTDSTSDFHTPTEVAGALTFSSLFSGQTHYCALTSAGDAWCWGFNAMVDTSGATTDADVPTEMPTDLTFKEIAPGFRHNCAISTSDVAYCWGQNPAGQLGDGSTTNRFIPAPVAGGFTFTKISSGTSHSCALAATGTAFCWGSNQTGQLGDGTSQQRTSPTAVTGGHTFQAIGAGETFSCGLRTDGKVYCWGAIGGAPANPTPFTYDTAPTFVSLSVGSQHACALTADGTAYCWGQNGGDGQGRLGDNTTSNRAAPTQVDSDLRFSQISAGHRHSCALTLTESAVACWGQNGSMELGNNTAAFFLVPRYIVLGVNP